jgi:glycosyl transferase family 87
LTSPRPKPASARTNDQTPLVVLLAVAAWATGFALYAFWRVGMDRSDFFLFYASGHAWWAGGTVYPLDQNPNLNPPTAVVALFAPLARLPYLAAQILWTLAGAVALFCSLRITARTLRLTTEQVLWVLAILSVTHAAFLVWMQGQLTWLLMYPVTRAWLALRSDAPVRAGLWLAPAIAIKPILALLPLVLPWRVWLTAGLVSAAMTLAIILWTGWSPWQEWLHVGNSVAWLEWPPNASLWGLAARLQSGELKRLSLGGLNRWSVAAVLAAGALLWIFSVRQPNTDRRFTFAIFWTVLMSPLGWIYYLPLGLAPMVASWPRNSFIWLAVACLVVPFHMIQAWFASPIVVRTVGCLYGLAVIIALAVWMRSDSQS